MAKAKVVRAAPRVTAEDRKWQAQDDLRTLQRAKEIQADKSRVTAATRMAQEQIRALQAVGARAPAGKK